MPTDDERREVARRLRGDPCDTLIPYRTGIHFGMGCHEAANRFWDMCERIKSAGDYDIAYSTRSVLADLIEPSCDRIEGVLCTMEGAPYPGEALPEIDTCDRDALLALADGLDKDADNIISAARDARFTGGRPRMGEAEHDAYEWRCIARRIRKALGVFDD